MTARKPDAARGARLASRALAAAATSNPLALGVLGLAAGIIGALAKTDAEAEAALVRFLKAEKP